MTATYVNSGNFTAGLSASPITTAAIGWTPAIGNVLYAWLRLASNAAANSPAVSDSVNGAYTAISSFLIDGGTGQSHAGLFKNTVTAATAPTFTFSWAGGNASYTLVIIEVNGQTGEIVAIASGSSATPTGGSVSPTGAGLLIVLAAPVVTNMTWSNALDNAGGAAMTIHQPASGSLRASEADLHEAAGTYQPRITMSASEGWTACTLFVTESAAATTSVAAWIG